MEARGQVVWRVVVTACIGLIMTGVGCKQAAEKAPAFGPMPVELLKLEEKQIPQYDEYLASLTSRHSITLYAQVNGYIRAIRTKPGTPVKKGAVLIEIDPRQQSATLRNLRANLATKQATLAFLKQNDESSRELARAGVISSLDYEQRRSQRVAAEADAQAAEAQIQAQSELLSYYRITAPTDGVSGDVPVKVGDYVTPETKLTSVDENDLIEAYVYVPVSKVNSIKTETTVALVDDDGNSICERPLTFVSTEVNVDTQTVLVKTACPNEGALRTAQVLKAHMIWTKRAGVTVPTAAVTRLAGQHFVFVASKGPKGTVAKQVPIQVDGIQGNDFVIVSGLKPGDEVIVSNLQKIRDGVPVAGQVKDTEKAPG